MLNSYEEATKWLFQQFPSYQKIGARALKPTLDNTLKLISALDLHPEKLRFVHIAGSNGKGTTAAIIASALKESGYKTGLFTSPHIKEFTERIRVNGEEIDKDSVLDFVKRVHSLELNFEPSFFEISFAMALDHFEKEQCDICVIETGLGGRLDSTNVIRPELSIITTISLEHTNFLGNTLEAVATEKGGIIKENIPVVIGEGAQDQRNIFESIAKEKNAPIYYVSPSYGISHFTLPFLKNSYQEDNFRTALKAIEFLNSTDLSIPEDCVQKGLNNLYKNTGYAGRLQVISEKPFIIYDASHNADGIEASIKAISGISSEELRIIYGTSSDKDLDAIIDVLPKNAHYYITEFGNERSAQIDDLKAHFYRKNLRSADYFKSPEKAMFQAKSDSSENDIILVIGSFFLLEHFF